MGNPSGMGKIIDKIWSLIKLQMVNRTVTNCIFILIKHDK